MFKLIECDPNWSEIAPFHFEFILNIKAEPEDVFDVIAGKDEKEWFPGYKESHWLTDLPHGAGSIRDYRMTSMKLLEIFLIWNRGQRLCFTVSECSLPFFRRFMEDYRISRALSGECELKWMVYYEPFPWVRFLHPFIRPFYKKDLIKACNNLIRYFERRRNR